VTFMGSRSHPGAKEAGEGVASSAMAASAGDNGSSYRVDNATGSEQGQLQHWGVLCTVDSAMYWQGLQGT
jgi:hypothetical protein